MLRGEDKLIRVLASDDLPITGGDDPFTWEPPKQVRVGAADVLLARMPGGEVVAFAAHCPHQATPLRSASIADGSVRCQQHGYVYDLATGQNLVPSMGTRPEVMWKLRPGYLRRHRVEERDGSIWVAAEPQPPPEGFDPESHTVAAPGTMRPARPIAPRPAPAPVSDGPLEHAMERVDAVVGAEFDLRLATNVVPGHLWRVEAPEGVAILGEAFDPQPPPSHRIRLVATAAGEATIRCSYAKPWGDRAREIRTFIVAARHPDG